LYKPKAARFQDLFTSAKLEFSPQVRMRLLPGDIISEWIAFTGIYELTLTRLVAGLARSGGLLIDVGANLGYFSLLWAASRPDNRVIAFEPAPRNLEFLRKNIAENGFLQQIEVRSVAAGRENGEMEFDLGPPEQTGWGGLVPAATKRSHSVRVVRLDDELQQFDEIRALKIDVEGADAWVLQGTERILRERRVQHVYFECNRPRMAQLGIDPDWPDEFLRDCGYRVRPLYGRDGREYHATTVNVARI
jgi:FkbM family methyltransferase